MNKVVAILKANLVAVIALVVALIALPLSIYFSTQWRASLEESVREDVGGSKRQLDSIRVTYEVPAVRPGEQGVSVSAPPNPASTERAAELLAQIRSESERVREAAIERNSAGKELLISGPDPEDNVFPAPASEDSRVRLLTGFAERWPEAHGELLASLPAGVPPAEEAVLRSLGEYRAQQIERLTAARSEKELTPGEREELREELSRRRLAIYRARAQDMTVYATRGVFEGVGVWEGGVPALTQAWEWQFVFWVHEDLIAAIKRANADGSSGWTPVFRAPVKRIERIAVDRWEYDERAGEVSVGEVDEGASLPEDRSVSFTGRRSWPAVANPAYDVRYADVELVVASAALPHVLDAFNTTNYMTVIGLDVERVDAAEALRRGYDYGGDHVVRAALRVETLWLRRWMLPWMPDAVRSAMGLPEREEASGDGDGDEGGPGDGAGDVRGGFGGRGGRTR